MPHDSPPSERVTDGHLKVLFLSHRLPFPPRNGAAVRTYNLLRGIAEGADITALCFDRFNEQSTGMGRAERIQALGGLGHFEVFDIPQLNSRARLVSDHARALALGVPYTHFIHRSPPYIERMKQLLTQEPWDVVLVDSLDLVGVLPWIGGAAPVVCTHHNVESELLHRRAGAAKNRLVSAYLSLQARRLRAAESCWLPRFRLNVAVSEEDKRQFLAIAPASHVAVIPNAVDVELFQPSSGSPTASDCVFVGGTSWYPNRDALEWYLSEIHPRLMIANSQHKTVWVGRMTGSERQRASRVGGFEATGFVEDIAPHVHSARVFVAPLRVGGGTRLKILEAWAMGMSVVTTSIGAEGLGPRHGIDCMIADSAEEFAGAVLRLLDDGGLRRRLGAEARRRAEVDFSWKVAGQGLMDLLQLASSGDHIR